ncbi:hypothetical protein M758_4G221800 [Ceratodon purpureus]|nr:hypothetical protein M758_4G221800 [Ceratodon purpureus]
MGRQRACTGANKREDCDSEQDEEPVAAIVHEHGHQPPLLVIVVPIVFVPRRPRPRPPSSPSPVVLRIHASVPVRTRSICITPVPSSTAIHGTRNSATATSEAIAIAIVRPIPAEELEPDDRKHGNPQQGQREGVGRASRGGRRCLVRYHGVGVDRRRGPHPRHPRDEQDHPENRRRYPRRRPVVPVLLVRSRISRISRIPRLIGLSPARHIPPRNIVPRRRPSHPHSSSSSILETPQPNPPHKPKSSTPTPPQNHKLPNFNQQTLVYQTSFTNTTNNANYPPTQDVESRTILRLAKSVKVRTTRDPVSESSLKPDQTLAAKGEEILEI